ncbi:MAG TPA: NADH:flavin oxidoreductase/NADH oxidase [Lentimicrobium sp.]|nr:NADH:flavin oxidoreductase/NADH oxidase [Lentimicrobium sp.]
MSRLFEPLTIKDITFHNRIVMSPMCQYSAENGFANDWHFVHLGSRAVGGAALIIVEATSVNPEGRISPGDLGLWEDAHIAPLKRITDFINTSGSIAGIQLAHAGRKASHSAPWQGAVQLNPGSGGWNTFAPSEIAYNENENAPTALDKKGINKIIGDFKSAASRAAKAGFKVLEIHAAHGYLIHEFLSPLTNHRTDEYGGKFENRIRLLLEIVEALKSEWPENFPLFVRLSATDWYEGGWDLDQTVQLAIKLKEKGVDLIDTSSGGNIAAQKIQLGPCYQAPFAEAVRRTGILTGAVGLITTPQQAEDILQNGQADLVLFARELLRDPYFPLHAAKELGDTITWPVQYLRAK